MSELILKSGPTLLWRKWEYDSAAKENRSIDLDVTDRAHEYLFESVHIDPHVLLSDIFKLLDAAPILTALFRRDFSYELLVEARKGVPPNFEYSYSPEGIEFLELYQCWYLNTATTKLEPVHRLDLRGIGYELREDLDYGDGCVNPAGTRVQWAISTTPIRELLAVPIRINPVISICENDLSAKSYSREIQKVQNAVVSLGQVLDGILWELSWFGSPEQQAEMSAQLQDQLKDIKREYLDSPSIKAHFEDDDIFEELNEPGFQTLFHHLGPHSKTEIIAALYDLEDDEPVQSGLRARLSDGVTIKPEFAAIVARTFRTLFREAE